MHDRRGGIPALDQSRVHGGQAQDNDEAPHDHPTLQLDDGEILTEGPAILQYLADSAPETGLAPATGTLDRARTMEQLNFVATELHKAFSPLFRESSSDASKAQAKKNVRARFDTVEALLADGRETLVPGQFTIADAYLFVVANWANFTGIPLPEWPNLARFMERTAARPSAGPSMAAGPPLFVRPRTSASGSAFCAVVTMARVMLPVALGLI